MTGSKQRTRGKKGRIALGALLLALAAGSVWLATTDRKKLARSVKLVTSLKVERNGNWTDCNQ